ncbi:hypothetical protein B0H19DRAFT_133463 [Mycena capillaripes]|nr:hypothetical protein B0H19DRAFT_133463 [Mycena capillaripes]
MRATTTQAPWHPSRIAALSPESPCAPSIGATMPMTRTGASKSKPGTSARKHERPDKRHPAARRSALSPSHQAQGIRVQARYERTTKARTTGQLTIPRHCLPPPFPHRKGKERKRCTTPLSPSLSPKQSSSPPLKKIAQLAQKKKAAHTKTAKMKRNENPTKKNGAKKGKANKTKRLTSARSSASSPPRYRRARPRGICGRCCRLGLCARKLVLRFKRGGGGV